MEKTPTLDLTELKRMGFEDSTDGHWSKNLNENLSIAVNADTGAGTLRVEAAQIVVGFLGCSHLKWFLEALVGGVYFKQHAWRNR